MWDAKHDLKKSKEQIEIKIVNCPYLFDYKVSLIVSVYSGGKSGGNYHPFKFLFKQIVLFTTFKYGCIVSNNVINIFAHD